MLRQRRAGRRSRALRRATNRRLDAPTHLVCGGRRDRTGCGRVTRRFGAVVSGPRGHGASAPSSPDSVCVAVRVRLGSVIGCRRGGSVSFGMRCGRAGARGLLAGRERAGRLVVKARSPREHRAVPRWQRRKTATDSTVEQGLEVDAPPEASRLRGDARSEQRKADRTARGQRPAVTRGAPTGSRWRHRGSGGVADR